MNKKLFGIIALIAIIVFSMASCEEPEWKDIDEFPSFLIKGNGNSLGHWTSDEDSASLIFSTRSVTWQN